MTGGPSANDKSALTVPQGLAARAWSWVGKGRGFLIAQSEQASERWAQHKGRVATAEALASLIVEEGRIAAQLKADLIRKAVEARDPEMNAYAEMMVRELDGKIRTLNVLAAAGHQLEKPAGAAEASAEVVGELSEHWLDRFFSLARARNEPWRDDLLAKALARETTNPRSISLPVLWKIGTLQELEFDSMAAMLDVCVFINGAPTILLPIDDFYATPVVGSPFHGQLSYGQVAMMLQEADLCHSAVSGASKTLRAGSIATIRYGQRSISALVPQDTRIQGFFLTLCGAGLAALYEQREVPAGLQQYDRTITRLQQIGCTIPAPAQ